MRKSTKKAFNIFVSFKRNTFLCKEFMQDMNSAMPYQLALSNDAAATPDIRVKPLQKCR
ncbi:MULTISPECIES: hypothetical protein [Bacteroides]|uniref:hypothetical protein n=1 Tax=Bacteroides TaxID=816 RepID=UPI000AB29E95|nr:MULTISPECIES: hypothetical protein [Bacteroides]MBX9094799.1 hypothetical protein [Bacteroides xylanisolvens]MBX9170405.1 hypothetical protein [Bacteroides xylanisolvens]